MKHRLLISDTLAESGLNLLQAMSELEVDYQPKLGQNPTELAKVIPQYHGLVVRSETKVTEAILKAGTSLKIIGRAGIGVDNIDVNSATKAGIIVMNTPQGNMTTTAEHSFALILALARKIPQACASVKQGLWDRKKFMGTELRGKKLGLVGCGNIGSIVAKRALSFGLEVLVCDPFLLPEKAIGLTLCDLPSLFKEADIISLHVPLTDQTRNLICKATLTQMKPTALLINCARGDLVNETDLAEALTKKKIAGCALDVFCTEPLPLSHPLLQFDNVIVTPHLGASTFEAQEAVAIEMANQLQNYFKFGEITNAVNTINTSRADVLSTGPWLTLANRLGRFLATFFVPQKMTLNLNGDIPGNSGAIVSAFLQGVLSFHATSSINSVNALSVAKDMGIVLNESRSQSHGDYAQTLEVTAHSEKQKMTMSGTLFGKSSPRLIELNGKAFDVPLQGHLLFIQNHDVPGVVGFVGTLLAQNQINIETLHLGQSHKENQAIGFYNICGNFSEEIRQKLLVHPQILSVGVLEFINHSAASDRV